MNFRTIVEKELIEKVDEQLQGFETRGQIFRVSIDGLGGTGKTTIARLIADQIDAKVISFDDYLNPRQGSYVPHLRYDEMANEISDCAKQGVKAFIFEGLCALDVLDRLGLTPDLSIYIRRVDKYGKWIDGFYYSEENDIEEVLQRLDAIEARRPDTPGITDSDRELSIYHIEKRPISTADYVIDLRREDLIQNGNSA